MISRREFTKVFGAAAAFSPSVQAAKIDSKVSGVQIGVQSYSFRDRSLDEAIKAMVEIGLGECELWQGHIEPSGLSKEDLRKWRTATPLDVFKTVREKFEKAGIELYAYNYSFRDDFTDEEISRGFDMARALGVRRLTASANVKTAARISPFAEKAKVWVGVHNHSRIVPNEFATPDDFAAALKGSSEYIAINLDIGHFLAAGFDPVDYLERNHQKIVTLHIKDRKKNQGDNVEFGKGDTPIKEVLRLLRSKHYKIPANIEYEYKGADTIAEVKKCFAYCKSALA